MMGDGGVVSDEQMLLMQPLDRHASDSQMIMQWDMVAASARHEYKRRQSRAASGLLAHSQSLLLEHSSTDIERGASLRSVAAGGKQPPLHACRILSYAKGHFMNDMLAALWCVRARGCCMVLRCAALLLLVLNRARTASRESVCAGFAQAELPARVSSYRGRVRTSVWVSSGCGAHEPARPLSFATG